MDNYKKWQLFSPLGLALIGFGASMLGHSIQLKVEDAKTITWFVWGTCSLIVFNAGIAIFAEAVKARVLYELREK
jgi:hypothetical protein